MIFSFSDKLSSKINFQDSQTDIFCFFHSENAVSMTENLWFHAAATTLKMKKNVLILEQKIDQFPSINTTQRWQVGDSYLWLAPRSLSVLFEATNANSTSYLAVKAFLTRYK